MAAHRLVTVTGPGGVGKTRLAVQVARRVAGRFADGGAGGAGAGGRPRPVPAVVAGALGLRLAPGAALAEALAGRQLLLVLDNCEHLAGAVASLCDAVLAAADDVRVLATSRSRRVAGEACYRLPPLGLPEPGDLAAVAGSEAARLFADRPGGAMRISCWMRSRARWPGRSWPGWTGCRWRSSWPRPGWRRWAWPSCWSGSMTGSRCWRAPAGWRRRGSGRWPRRWTGVTSCSMSMSGGCSGRWRCSRGRSRWRRPRRWPARTRRWRCCTWWSSLLAAPRPGRTGGPGT